uniref:DNA topoisomerase family protein n=2 Tax=Enterobacteriaceae TaxID=543 RepID=UPI003396E5CE
MTAAWEQELEKVASGSGNMSVFMKQISTWICQMVEQLKVPAPVLTKEGGAMAKAFEGAKPPSHECFNCGGEMHRIKGKNGFFWGCQNEACKKTFPDNRGKPEKRIAAEDCPDCPDCGSPMRLRKGKAPGKKRASKFWGCTAYPDCKGTMPFKSRTLWIDRGIKYVWNNHFNCDAHHQLSHCRRCREEHRLRLGGGIRQPNGAGRNANFSYQLGHCKKRR